MKACLVFILIVICMNSLLHAKPPRLSRIRRNAYRDENKRWPNAIVPFVIDKDFRGLEKLEIVWAMVDIMRASCVRFKMHSGEQGYLEIVKGKGCSAVAGYRGNRQTIKLGDGCFSRKTLLHELFHVLGFRHEHARPDRDQYVKIKEHNIKPEKLHNFRKLSGTKFTSFGLPYDYNSVLHYHDKGFAIDRSQKSMEPIDGNQVLGKATGMSKMDILKLNRMYPCQKKKQEYKKLPDFSLDLGSHIGNFWEGLKSYVG